MLDTSRSKRTHGLGHRRRRRRTTTSGVEIQMKSAHSSQSVWFADDDWWWSCCCCCFALVEHLEFLRQPTVAPSGYVISTSPVCVHAKKHHRLRLLSCCTSLCSSCWIKDAANRRTTRAVFFLSLSRASALRCHAGNSTFTHSLAHSSRADQIGNVFPA